ncbi:hypothetical protein NE865_11003 [Phthorimaea operculella]|nr:hypothetical protein NE865_11003 [Phthorimaea operculella]
MLRTTVLLLFAIFGNSQAAFVDTLGKCSVKDNQCLAKLFTTGMSSAAKTGIPEYDIPPFDPFVIKDVSASVLNVVEITMVDGVAKNIKSCVFDRLELNMEELHSSMDITCDVTIKGHYKVKTINPIIQNTVGSDVTGDGNGKVKMDKFQMKFETDFSLREKDGELYFDWKYEDMRYNYTFEHVAFSANSVKMGSLEISGQVLGVINQNWEFIMTTFGKPFIDIAMSIVDRYMHKFFDVTPAKVFMIEDLSQYKKN